MKPLKEYRVEYEVGEGEDIDILTDTFFAQSEEDVRRAFEQNYQGAIAYIEEVQRDD